MLGIDATLAASSTVFFGATACAVSAAVNVPGGAGAVDVSVPLCAFAASTVSVTVAVPGRGWALGAAPGGHAYYEVEQLLLVDSISPAQGSRFGGTRVTVHGSGFGGRLRADEPDAPGLSLLQLGAALGGDGMCPSGDEAGGWGFTALTAASAAVGFVSDGPARAISAATVGGLPCAADLAEAASHAALVCFTAAVPLYNKLRPAASGGVRVGCALLESRTDVTLAGCQALCDATSTCSAINFRAFPRACELRACTAGACDDSACSYMDATSSAGYEAWTSLELARFAQAVAVSVRVGDGASAVGSGTFAYESAAAAPQLTALRQLGDVPADPSASLLLELTVAGLPADDLAAEPDALLIVLGLAADPSANLRCNATTGWNGTQASATVQCAREAGMTPAGEWAVRVWSAAADGYSSALPLTVAAIVDGVAMLGSDGAASGGALRGGLHGGLELLLVGAGLGLDASQNEVRVCGSLCTPTSSNGTHATCTTGKVGTEGAEAAVPAAYQPVDLAPFAAAYSTDRPFDAEEERFSRQAWGRRVDERLRLRDSAGVWRTTSDSCWFAFSLPAGQVAAVSAARIYPATDPVAREAARAMVIEARNLTIGDGPLYAAFGDEAAWTVLAQLDSLLEGGMSVGQGWNSWAMEPPVLAQAFRVRLPAGACAHQRELLRGATVEGTLRTTADPSACPITLGPISHPLASVAGAAPALALAPTVELSLEHTPKVFALSPRSGSARGGTTVTISGERLAPRNASGALLEGQASLAAVRVELNGYACTPTSVVETSAADGASTIECVTAERDAGILPTSTRVWVSGYGDALVADPTASRFDYIDLWSDERSWLHSEKPVDGDSVIVPEGQAILLDEDSPKLFLLLVSGLLEFARKDVSLNATYIWVAGGELRVGLEEEPFLHKATITLHGDRWSTIELPFVGAKMLAVTNLGGLTGMCHDHGHTMQGTEGRPASAACPVRKVGRLELHGAPQLSWTRIVRTALQGELRLSLAEPVGWPVGARILITQSNRGEAEELRHVAAIEDDGYTLVLDEPLANEHLGVWHWHDEAQLPSDLRAAVGLLERNVVIQGDDASAQRGSSFMFGAHVGAFHGGVMRVENTEFTRTGQAANLGRYNFHWHHLAMAGRTVDVLDLAYIRNCSIHHTFQRAVVVHGTNYAVVQHNLAYKATGHNFFTEEGPEKFALFDHNLAVGAQPLTLMLGDDAEAAGFWLPGFTGWHRHNMAVDCPNGWKVNKQPGAGAAQTDLTFFNNSAQLCGFGWRLFPPHQPRTLNTFDIFTAFRCSTGMFYYSSGNINHFNHHFIECSRAVHLNHYMNALHDEPFFTNLVLVGNIDPSATRARAGLGIHSPKDDEYWFVSGMHVSAYHSTPVLYGCFETACTMRYEKVTWVDSDVRIQLDPGLAGIYHDMDGTLTGRGAPNQWVSFDGRYNHWEDGLCEWGNSHYPNGIVCGHADGSTRMRRLLLNGQEPWQLDGKPLNVTSSAGSQPVPFTFKKLYGWAVPVIAGREYDLQIDDPNDFTQLRHTYSTSPYVFARHGFEGRMDSPTICEPVVERLTLHYNYTDWRNRFDGTYGSRLNAEPDPALDTFGSWAHKLWAHDCDLYANLSAASLSECDGSYRNESTDSLKFELNQQPDKPRVRGRLSTVISEKSAPTGMRQAFIARECPEAGCWQPPPIELGALRMWSDPTVWECQRLTAGATVRTCSPSGGPTRRRRMLEAAEVATSAAMRVLPTGSLLLRAVRASAGRRLQASEVETNTLPAAGDNVDLDEHDNIELDVVTPILSLVTVVGRLAASRTTSSVLRCTSMHVWGQLELGSPDDPIPAGVTASLELHGGQSQQNVVMSEGLSLSNNAVAVLGSLTAAGAPLGAPLWTKLSATAVPGATALTVRGDFSSWPVGAQVAIGATEYPQPPASTQTETRTLSAAPTYNSAAGTTTLRLDAPLSFRHFAGQVLPSDARSHWPSLQLSATVALILGHSNVVIRTGEQHSGFGGVVTIGGSSDGVYVGVANLSHVEFAGMGDFAEQLPALHFNYIGDSVAGAATEQFSSRVEHCSFGFSQAGAVQVDGAGALSLIGNVFHRNRRTALWVGSRPPDAAGVHIVGNAALDTLRHSAESEDFVRPFASFLIEARVGSLLGNIAAGSADSGFTVRPSLAACVAGESAEPLLGQAELNEAVATVVGVFALRACPGSCNSCAAIRGFVVWKAAHAGVLTVDQSASMRLSDVAVSDNHIGITLNFHRPSETDTAHRVFYHNLTILGSSAASTCAHSVDCRAYGQFGEDVPKTTAQTCNSVVGSARRRVGVLSHMVNALGKLCEASAKLPLCRPPNTPVKDCVMPWEHRIGTVGGRYSEAHWSAITFGQFAADDCGRSSVAFTYNPTAIDAGHPQHFRGVVWSASAPDSARFALQSLSANADNRVSDCAPGSDCDGLMQMLIVDTDGSLSQTGQPDTTLVPIANPAIATSRCETRTNHFVCGAQRRRILRYEMPGALRQEAGRTFGNFKLFRVSDGRSTWSRGPFDDMCLTSVAAQTRHWAVKPNDEYNLTFFTSPPKLHAFHYYDGDSASSIVLRLFLTQPFAYQVFQDGVKLEGVDSSDVDTFAGEGAPRMPRDTDAHGTFAFSPQERRLRLTVRGGADRTAGSGVLLLRLLMVVQLSLTVSMPAVQLDRSELVANLALLLSIDPSRIKIVQVQSAAAVGTRRRLQDDEGGTTIQVQILEPEVPIEDDLAAAAEADAAGACTANCNATNATTSASFSEESLSELSVVATSVSSSNFSAALGAALNSSVEVSSVQFNEVEEAPVSEEPSEPTPTPVPSASGASAQSTSVSSGEDRPGDAEPPVDPGSAAAMAMSVSLVAALFGAMAALLVYRRRAAARAAAKAAGVPVNDRWFGRLRRESSFDLRTSSFERRRQGDPKYAQPFSTTDQPEWQLNPPSEPGSSQSSARRDGQNEKAAGGMLASRLFGQPSARRGAQEGKEGSFFSRFFSPADRDSSPHATPRQTLLSGLFTSSPKKRARKAPVKDDELAPSNLRERVPSLVREEPGQRLSVSHAADSLAEPSSTPMLRVAHDELNFKAEQDAVNYM